MASPSQPAPQQPPVKVDTAHAATTTSATTATTEHGHGHESGVFPPFNKETFGPQLLWLALLFGFLYYMLATRLLPRISQVIEDRADGIRGDLAEAEHLKTETEASLRTYELALAAAKTDAAGIAKTQSDALAAEQDRERAAVDAQTAAKIADAEKQIAASKATALSAVSDVAGQTVAAIIAKLTGQTVTGDEVAHAIEAVRAK